MRNIKNTETLRNMRNIRNSFQRNNRIYSIFWKNGKYNKNIEPMRNVVDIRCVENLVKQEIFEKRNRRFFVYKNY